jgi:hypothetical protein
MAWSYDNSALATSDKDVVRLIIGDTDTNDQLLANEEINYFLTLHGTVVRAASESARAIAAKFARLMSRSVGGLQADFAAKYRQYLELANNLLQNEEISPVSPYLSGYLYSQHKTRADDTDRIPIFGRKGVTDNPEADAAGDYANYRDYYHR